MMMNFSATTSAGLLLLASAAAAHGDALLDEAVTFNAAILHLQTDVPGLLLGAVRQGEVAIAGMGETRKGNGIQPDGDTVLRIGSITKVFAGEMLAHAVARGEARFTDPVADLLPGRLAEAAFRHAPITLVDLATHSGGLPREVPREEGPENDPFSTITPEAFAQWLEGNELQFQPGTAIAYSNFGFDLLAAAIETAGKADYATLLEQRITAPLDMASTGFEFTGDMQSRLMSGHGPDGEPLTDIPSGDVIVGSGGLRSTANDLMRWLEWHLGDQRGNDEVRFLDHAVYVQRDGKTAVLAMDESGRMDAMGLGWVVMNETADRPFILQKAGALHGQMSYIAFAPAHGTAVFVSINQFDFSAAYAMTEVANNLLSELSGY
jgi:D-alanyl-D-alanine-carboxypeptidase/D-alanyl-D-alanine-endopeptidase